MSIYYQDSKVTLYHGDCRDILPRLTADSVITDPPYAVDKNGQMLGYIDPDYSAKTTHTRGYADHHPEAFSRLMGDAFQGMYNAVPDGTVHVAFGGNRTLHQQTVAAENAGFTVLDLLVFSSPNGVAKSKSTLAPAHEIAVLLRKGKPRNINPTWKQKNAWDIPKPRVMDTGHVTTKPLSWMRALIELTTSPGETVLDPFVGSGTTMLAARELGRPAIGVELVERYCEIAAQRLSQDVLDLGGIA